MTKIEKVMYPFMMVCSLGAAILETIDGGNATWPMLTFLWVGIAWANFKRN